MASPRPKSPRTPNRNEKEESFWDKIGTLGRKKRIKEGNLRSQEIAQEIVSKMFRKFRISRNFGIFLG